MPRPKILVFSGSIRTASSNTLLDGVTRISLSDCPLPLYHGDAEAKSGPPANAVGFKRLFGIDHDASSPPPAIAREAIYQGDADAGA